MSGIAKEAFEGGAIAGQRMVGIGEELAVVIVEERAFLFSGDRHGLCIILPA